MEAERGSPDLPIACEHEWELQDHGSQSMDVCVKCGSCNDHVIFEVEEGLNQNYALGASGSAYVSADGTLSGKGNSRTPVPPEKRRELRFIRIIKEVANTARLNKTSLNACIAEARDLLKTNENIGQGMKKFAAGLVYMELKKTSPNITYQSASDLLGVKKKILGGVVKKLTARAKALEREIASSTVPFERRLSDILERFYELPLSQEKRQEVKKTAYNLREICADVPSKNNFLLLDTDSLDYGYFALALQVVDQSQDEKTVVTMVSKKSELHYTTLKHKVYQIRTRLLRAAKEIPSLEHIEGLNSRVILRYLPTILQNKDFLLKGADRFNYITDTPQQAQQVPLTSDPWQRGAEEEDENLSDLDPDEVEEYIASEGEVEKKRLSMEQSMEQSLEQT